jgi:hypothetical protein
MEKISLLKSQWNESGNGVKQIFKAINTFQTNKSIPIESNSIKNIY